MYASREGSATYAKTGMSLHLHPYFVYASREGSATYAKTGPLHPKLTWIKLMEKDCREWKLSTVLCVQLASYLEGDRLVWMMPLLLHFNQIFDYDLFMMAKSTKFEPTKSNDSDKIVYRCKWTMKSG